MCICIFGVGVVGSYIVVWLVWVGYEVLCVMWGVYLEVVCVNGFKLWVGEFEVGVRVNVLGDLV